MRQQENRHEALGTQTDYVLFEPYLADLGSVIEEQRNVARIDRLSGLLNQAAWQDTLEKQIKRNESFGIFLLDFDNFKEVNDRLSHVDGNAIIKDFGVILKSTFRRRDDIIVANSSNDIVAPGSSGRLGGDEFGIIFSLVGNYQRGSRPHERMDNAWKYLQSVTDVFVDALPAPIQALDFGVSFGGSVFNPDHPTDALTLLGQADEAMYEMKQLKKDRAS